LVLVVLKRLAFLGPTLLIITAVTFILSTVIPADPAQMAAGLEAGPEQVARVRAELGLDRPIHEQYMRYLSRLVRGDLGRSMMTRRPVLEDLALRLPVTVELVLIVMVIYVFLSIPIGVHCAVHSGGLFDRIVRPVSVGLAAMPVFWLSLLLQLLFYRTLRILPAVGRLSPDLIVPRISGMLLLDSLLAGSIRGFLDAVSHLVLPVTALVIGRLPVAIKQTRASMVGALSEQFVVTARAKGVLERKVVWRHALKFAFIPVITMLGLQFGWLLGGTVLVEVVFAIPGLGQYMVNAVAQMDLAPILGGTLVIAIVFVLMNTVVDIAYVLLDPRIRIS